MKKNFSYKVSSALMCAAMAGTTVATPIMSQVSANTDENAAKQEVMQSDVTGNSASDISVFMNNSTSAVMLDGTQQLETFTRKVLSMTGVELDDTVFRIDWVDASGLRSVLRNGDADADAKQEIQTLSDFYDFVKQQNRETTLVIFTNSSEVARIVLSVKEDGSLFIDTVKGTPDVSYLVRFDANGGELTGSSFVMRAQGEQLSYVETTASYDRHAFDGWYDAKVGGNKVDETTVINSNVRLYAHWIADTYRVDFDTQGGNEIEPKFVSIDEVLYDLPTPEKEGHTFLGWYTESDGGSRVISVKDAKDVTLYARWDTVTTVPTPGSGTVTPTPTPDNDTSENDNVTGTVTPTPTPNGVTGTTTPTPTSTPVVATYKLNVVKADGSSMNVSAKPTVSIGALVKKLGYTNVSHFSMKTSSGSESTVDSNTTLEAVAKFVEDGDITLMAYDAANEPVGSAKITKTGDNEYKVSLSKDTEVSDKSSTPTPSKKDLKGAVVGDNEITNDGASNVDGKGKGEGETPKDDSTAAPVKTADMSVVPVYGTMGSVMTALLGVLAAMKRKLS